MLRVARLAAAPLLLALVAMACGDKLDPGGDPSACTDKIRVTYQSHIKKFFQRHCLYCHSLDATNRNGAPITVNFDTYADALPVAARAAEYVRAETMPPSIAPSFPDAEERCQFDTWAGLGFPEK